MAGSQLMACLGWQMPMKALLDAVSQELAPTSGLGQEHSDCLTQGDLKPAQG